MAEWGWGKEEKVSSLVQEKKILFESSTGVQEGWYSHFSWDFFEYEDIS